MTNTNTSVEDLEARGDRKVVARWVLLGSFIIIGGVSVATAAFAIIGYLAPQNGRIDPEKAAASLTVLLNALLPVMGAWIGALIAFYFARDNYIAATESAKVLLGDRTPQLETIAAGDAMIKLPQMEVVRTPEEDAKPVKGQILDRFVAKGLSRLPVLTTGNKPKGVVHDSVVQQFLIEQPANAAPTLAHMLADQKVAKRLAESAAYVAATATLKDVKAAMDRRSKETSSSCRDVLVTTTGDDKGEVVGYISDMDLAKRGAFG